MVTLLLIINDKDDGGEYGQLLEGYKPIRLSELHQAYENERYLTD